MPGQRQVSDDNLISTNGSEDIELLLQRVHRGQSSFSSATWARIKASVVRPLAAESGKESHTADISGTKTSVSESSLLWELAQEATSMYRSSQSTELFEATAALQELACNTAASDDEREERLNWFKTTLADTSAMIRTASNGPILVRNVVHFVNWLGETVPSRPLMALCRCGSSSTKPFCDGSHVPVGFRDAKDLSRVPDRRDKYVGQQITILDNRGLCQHSGLCTDRLFTVFHLKSEPWITPSGGRMDEIIRAVRDCPSGALSYAVDGVEERSAVDFHDTRPPAIEITKNGPYRVTGGFRLEQADGTEVERNQGASLEHFALCRCGRSRNKPFCSGMHWYVEFLDPVPDPDAKPTIFEWAGGLSVWHRMVRIFYEKYVPEDDLLAPLFADMSVDHPERVAKWLSEVFCGPKFYSTQYGGYPRMLSQHIGKCITEEMRARWVSLLLRSAREAGLPNDPEFFSTFESYIAWGSRLAVENSQTESKPPEKMPMPHWDWTTAAGPPGSRISALSSTEKQIEADPTVILPAPEELVSFSKHIKPLFRRRDRDSMQFAFDLWSHPDVSLHAEAIHERLANGSMPCDGAWPQERVAVFARWIESGKQE